MDYKYSLVACARWEEHDIVEWIEYHRSIGFEHFFIYSNDDSPETQLKVLQPYVFGPSPIVTYTFWPRLGEQSEMYAHFLGNHKERTEWACFLDIDEFLVLKNVNNIDLFMQQFNAKSDCIYFNWLNYGNNGKKTRDRSSILSTLTRRSRSIDVHTKTLFRTKFVSEQGARQGAHDTGHPYTHFWNRYPFKNFRMCDVLGRDVADYADNFPQEAVKFIEGHEERILNTGYVAHYIIKSEEDFLRRAARGGFTAQVLWKERYERDEHHGILQGLNEVEDVYLSSYWDHYTDVVLYPIGRYAGD